jgi:fatty acid CoA ligase FadD9
MLPSSSSSGASGTAPAVGWTPNEAWLFAETARRALVASIDGAPPEHTAASDEGAPPFFAEIHARKDDVRLVLTLRGSSAAISLATGADGPRWREGWVLGLSQRGTPIRELVPGGTPWIPARADEPVEVRLLVRKRERVDEGAPEPRIALGDVAFHRYTRQSSVADDAPREGTICFARSTRLEPAPFWEIDLGAITFIETLRIEVAALPESARPVVRLFAFPAPGGAVPGSATRLEAPSLRIERGTTTVVSCEACAVARLVRVEIASDEDVALHVLDASIFGVSPFAETLRGSWRRALTLFADRPMLLAQPSEGEPFEPTHRYREVGAAALALARRLGRRLGVDPRPFVALMTRTRAEWVAADIACVEAGHVVVPIAPSETDERLQGLASRIPFACFVCEPGDVARVAALHRTCPTLKLVVVCGAEAAPPPTAPPTSSGPEVVRFEDLVAQPDDDAGDDADEDAEPARSPVDEGDLYSIGLTSGSSGVPKGAMRSYATFHAMLRTYGVAQPAIYLSFQPLSHLSERMFMPSILLQGGAVGISRGGAHVARELRAFAPTGLGSVPRLFDELYATYQRALRRMEASEPGTPFREIEQRALVDARAAFGGRLQWLSVGSAPVAPEVFAFLARCFAGIWVTEGYGSTEVGTIAVDGNVPDTVDVKLVGDDGAVVAGAGRGEILARTPHLILGYFGDEDATRRSLDASGYFRTGDLGERGADGKIRVVGRLRNATKLPNGEFVSVEEVEAKLATCPLVDRIVVHVEPESGVTAIVAPVEPTTTSRMAAALRAHGVRAGLDAATLPTRVHVLEEAPTVENGLLTASGKVVRAAFVSRLPTREAFDTPPSSRPVLDDLPDDPMAARLSAIASAVVRRRIRADEPLAGAVDSLAAGEILTAIEEELGRPVGLEAWFASRTLLELSARIASVGGGWRAESASMAEAREDLVRPLAARPAVAARSFATARTVLLTGATGFLGAHLLEALLERTKLEVTCLVRASDHDAARRRLEERVASYAAAGGVTRGVTGTAAWRRVHVFAGDLAEPHLGVGADALEARIRSVDLVLHAGATVSWLAPYATLRRPNVAGTHTLLELAATRGCPFHFVSTISTAPADGDESTLLDLDTASRGSAYGLSKWVAESLVRRAGAAGLDVAIYRPAMIAGHAVRGNGNPDDYLHRYMAGCVELGLHLDDDRSLIDMTPVDFVADGIVALLLAGTGRGDVHHLVNVRQSMTYAQLGSAMRAAGCAVEPARYEVFRAALLASNSRLRALAAYFPERGSALAMGPWPCSATEARLATLGVVAPRIDEALVRRYVDAMARSGGIPSAEVTASVTGSAAPSP